MERGQELEPKRKYAPENIGRVALERSDKHHLLFPRQEWELRPQAKRLREMGSFIVTMLRSDHDAMHRAVDIVPVPSHNTLMRLERGFKPTGDTASDIDGLALAIERATSPEHELERQLGQLTVEAIMQEKQFLKENGYVGKRAKLLI